MSVVVARQLIYFATGGSEGKEFFHSSIERLNEWLQAEFGVRFSVRELSTELQDQVLHALQTQISSSWGKSTEAARAVNYDEIFEPVLAVYCPHESQIKQNGIAGCPSGRWGVSDGATFAVIYESDNRQLIWHELLHTLSAQDCYTDDAGHSREPSCESNRPECLMRFDPSDFHCGASPSLCEHNRGRISRLADIIRSEAASRGGD